MIAVVAAAAHNLAAASCRPAITYVQLCPVDKAIFETSVFFASCLRLNACTAKQKKLPKNKRVSGCNTLANRSTNARACGVKAYECKPGPL